MIPSLTLPLSNSRPIPLIHCRQMRIAYRRFLPPR
jgi:hypothetical protein